MILTTEQKKEIKRHLAAVLRLLEREVDGELIGAEDKTNRGFRKGEFVDQYNHVCTIQKSSAAMYDAIWLGIKDANPEIMVSDAIKMGILDADKRTGEDRNGWMPYPVPPQVLMHTDMHLSQEHVLRLLPILLKFAATGELYNY